MLKVVDIAEHAGVSLSTVSRVLNDQDGVSPRTRQRVLDAVRELEALEAERRLHGEAVEETASEPEIETLSVLTLHPAGVTKPEVFNGLLKGIRYGAEAFNVQLTLSTNVQSLDKVFYDLYFADPALRPDSVIMLFASRFGRAIQQVQNLGLPVVMVGEPRSSLPFADAPANANLVLAPDGAATGYDATEYLVNQGHNAIAFLGRQTPLTWQLLEGYRQALIFYDIMPRDDRVLLAGVDDEPFRPAELFIEQRPPATAVLFDSADVAEYALPRLREAGYVIPQGLKVLVLEDAVSMRRATPALTAMAWPYFEQGHWAVRLLLELHQEQRQTGGELRFKARLVERESHV